MTTSGRRRAWRLLLVAGLFACSTATEPETPGPGGPKGPPAGPNTPPPDPDPPTEPDPPSSSVAPLVVTLLDVGQGDAIWIENGRSKVLIDGGPSTTRIADWIAERELTGDTLDLVILSHAHADHYAGLRELFKTRHNLSIRTLYENGDPATAVTLGELRDSIASRVERGELELRDTDDPCGDGRAVCTHTLDGGAILHVLRPLPEGSVNDRSVAVKLIGPDSASFTMWLSGDAENEALAFFEAEYSTNPGLDVDVLKGNHHGSCNGVTYRWLELTTPDWTTFGVSSTNTYGHVHSQTKLLHRAFEAPWLRTDENGRITFRTEGAPGSGYSVSVERDGVSLDGGADRAGATNTCGDLVGPAFAAR